MQKTKKAFMTGSVLTAGLSAGLCGAVHANQQSIDLGLSDHLFEAGYAYEFRPDVNLSAGLLRSNSNDRTSNLLSVGFGVSGDLTSQVRPRIGAKVFVLDGKGVNGRGRDVVPDGHAQDGRRGEGAHHRGEHEEGGPQDRRPEQGQGNAAGRENVVSSQDGGALLEAGVDAPHGGRDHQVGAGHFEERHDPDDAGH